jgi:hypothetical protein
VSPSTVNSLLQCELRVAFMQDSEFRQWLRPTPRSSLGIVAHQLAAESAAQQTARSREERSAAWLENRWETLVQSQSAALKKAWAPASPPEPKDWPGYALVKVRLIRRLLRQQAGTTGEHQTGTGLPAHTGQPTLPLLERKMSDSATGIHGTPDRVERSGGRLRVIDLKSGLRQSDVTDDQRRQMLLYSHLVATTLGETPDDLIITDVAGNETLVPSSSSAVADAVLQAQQARDSWNSAIADAPTALPLASPDQQACRWCPYRVVCLPSWQACEPGWEIPAAASGVVKQVARADSHLEVEITQDLPLYATGDPARLVGGARPEFSVGDHVVATDLDRVGQATYRLRWSSRLRVTARQNT